MRQPIQVLVYAATQSRGEWRYLLLRRIPRLDGFWQGITGGVEGDESILEAAQREFMEETALPILEIHQVDFSYSYPVADKWRYLYAEGVESINEYVFVAIVEGQSAPTIDPSEHDQWEWLDFEQALLRLTWPSDIEALKRTARHLRGNATTSGE